MNRPGYLSLKLKRETAQMVMSPDKNPGNAAEILKPRRIQKVPTSPPTIMPAKAAFLVSLLK